MLLAILMSILAPSVEAKSLAEAFQKSDAEFLTQTHTRMSSVNDQAQTRPVSPRSKPRLGLPTLPEDESDEPYYNTVEVGYAWLTGFGPEDFWDNTTNCFDRMTNYTYHERPALRQLIDSDILTDLEQIHAEMLVVKNLSLHLMYCNDAWISFNRYIVTRSVEFESVSHVFLSFMSNLVGSYVSLQRVLFSLQSGVQTSLAYTAHYETARLLRLLLIFEPIELLDNQDPGQNGNGGSDQSAQEVVEIDESGIPQLIALTAGGVVKGHKADKDYGPLYKMADTLLPRQSETQHIKLRQGTDQVTPTNTTALEEEIIDTVQGLLFEDKLGNMTMGSWSDFDGVRDAIDLFLGFTNATQFTFGGSRTECQHAGENIWQYALEGWDTMTDQWFSWFDFWESINKYLNVPYNLYTLSSSCSSSIDEISELVAHYRSLMSDVDKLAFNLFYSGGDVIKGITNVVMYFYAQEYTRVQDAFTMGMELGQIFWLLFFPVQEYLDEALDNGAVWGQDYTWDTVIHMEKGPEVDRVDQLNDDTKSSSI